MKSMNGASGSISRDVLYSIVFALSKEMRKDEILINRRSQFASVSFGTMWQLILVFIAAGSSVLAQDCKIKINANDTNASLYFNVFKWTRPKHSLGNVETIKHGAVVQLTCENGFIKNDLIANTYNFQCVDGKYNKTLEIEDLLCRATFHKPTEVFRISPTEMGSKIFKCDQNGWEAFKVRAKKPDGSSRHLYNVCFDRTVYRTKFVLQPRRKDEAAKTNGTRSDTWGFDFWGNNAHEKVKLSEGYVAKIQKDRLTKAFPEKYNPQHPYPYTFQRGHLAAYADFIDLEDKRASDEYLNVAPQWKEFNGNSWSLVERQARDMIKSNPYDWEIYTGTYSAIPTTKGPLYVSPLFDKSGKYVKSYVQVPKLYWKVVYNLVDKSKSKAFVGINNPELRSPAQFTDKYVICKPIPDKNGNKFQGSEFKGFTYECQLEEFLEKLRAEEKIIK